MRRLETPEVIGGRKASTEWTSCFGARHYHPHIKLLRPGSEIERDLRPIDEAFCRSFQTVEFGKYEVRMRTPGT